MRFKCFLMIIAFISIGNVSQAEKHNATPELAEEFETAVKNVENKKFLDAVKIFEKLAQKGLPEAQLICLFILLWFRRFKRLQGSHWSWRHI